MNGSYRGRKKAERKRRDFTIFSTCDHYSMLTPGKSMSGAFGWEQYWFLVFWEGPLPNVNKYCPFKLKFCHQKWKIICWKWSPIIPRHYVLKPTLKGTPCHYNVSGSWVSHPCDSSASQMMDSCIMDCSHLGTDWKQRWPCSESIPPLITEKSFSHLATARFE